MKGIVTVILAVLLFSPAIVSAAERKAAQEPPAAAAAKTIAQKLDLNRVSREDLLAVPGIGPRMAQAIIDLRTKNGPFKRIEDLLAVTGIKEKKLTSLAAYLDVPPVQASTAITTPAAPSR